MDALRLTRLLDRYMDEALTPEEQWELEQILLGSAEARRIFWEQMRFHGTLREYGERSWGMRLAGQSEFSEKRAPPRLRLLFSALYDSHLGWALATGIVLIVAARFWFSDRASPPAGEQTTSAIAALTQVVDAEWADDQVQRTIGASLAPGWINLKSGMAQIEFISGARVILEGPAEFQLISPMEAFCRSGRMTAEIPPPAHGFKVRSPGATVVDLGTAFGLSVQKSGEAEVQVLRGEVEVHRKAGESRGLVEGQGVRVGADGSMDDMGDAPEAVYPSSEMLALRSLQGRAQRKEAWIAREAKFSSDAGLSIHYTFEESSSWSRLLHNTAKNPGGETDGSIVGCRWSEGRWAGKRALEFHGVTDRVRFSLPGTFQAVTLAASVRVDGLDLDLNGLMMTEGWNPGAMHWQLTRSGMVRLGVSGAGNFDSPTVITAEGLGQWIHLAVVCDRAMGKVTHYVNGQPVSSSPMKLGVPLQIGNAELGNWSPGLRHDQRPIRNLAGSMDEFFLFDRALDENEIRALCPVL